MSLSLDAVIGTEQKVNSEVELEQLDLSQSSNSSTIDGEIDNLNSQPQPGCSYWDATCNEVTNKDNELVYSQLSQCGDIVIIGANHTISSVENIACKVSDNGEVLNGKTLCRKRTKMMSSGVKMRKNVKQIVVI